MRVLFFYQHFWPDSPPYANMLRAMGQSLVANGHEVQILTAQPSYKAGDRAQQHPARDQLDGIQVRRLSHFPGSNRHRLISQLGRALFPLRACLAIFKNRLKGESPDVIVAATIPPVINGLFALLAAKLSGARFVYHLQDIYPEIGAAGGLWPSNSIRHRLLLKLDTFAARRATRCVVLCEDMRQALAARGMDTQHVVLINNFMLKNFSLDAGVEAVSPTSSKQADLQAAKRSKLVFAGNLGRFQGLDDLLDAFLDLDKSKCKLDLHFLGEGAMASILKEKAANAENIFFHGHKPFEEASHFISDCDAGIVSIQPDVYRYAYPSKTLTYLGLGVPVLAVVEPESGMAKDIVKNELGIVSKGRSRQELQAAFMELSQWLKHEQNRSEKVNAWFNENATADAAFARWHQLFNQIAIEDASSKTQPAANHE